MPGVTVAITVIGHGDRDSSSCENEPFFSWEPRLVGNLPNKTVGSPNFHMTSVKVEQYMNHSLRTKHSFLNPSTVQHYLAAIPNHMSQMKLGTSFFNGLNQYASLLQLSISFCDIQ